VEYRRQTECFCIIEPVNVKLFGRALQSLSRNLTRKEFAVQVLMSGLRADAEPKAKVLDFLKAFPESKRVPVELGEVRYRIWNMDPTEQFCVAAMAAVRKPQRVFEIGTFDGTISLLIARNAPDAHVTTLDLPPDADPKAKGPSSAKNRAGGTGSRFVGQPERERITQLLGDSRSFDFSPYFGSMDMVVVDGGHRADCVIPDTANALKMLAPGGLVVWDDYVPRWPDVIKAVDEVASRNRLPIVRIANTGLAVLDSTRIQDQSNSRRAVPPSHPRPTPPR
jgi:predicted O-methyltransferase YrrM